MQRLAEAALEPQPGRAGADAANFVLTVLNRLPAGLAPQVLNWLKLHAAVNLRSTHAAKTIEDAIDQHFAHGQAPPPEYLREYRALSKQTGKDYTRRPRGGDPWRHAARNCDLARAAYEWRLTKRAYDWRIHHPDLAAPAACLHWSANALTETLDCIAKCCAQWPAGLEFFPPAELCSVHRLPIDDDQHDLLRRIYPDHFRGLLIEHVAAVCLDEWERRIADGPQLP